MIAFPYRKKHTSAFLTPGCGERLAGWMLIAVITLQILLSKNRPDLAVAGLSDPQPWSWHGSALPGSPVPKQKWNHTFIQKEKIFRFMKYRLRLWRGKKRQHLLCKWEMASNSWLKAEILMSLLTLSRIQKVGTIKKAQELWNKGCLCIHSSSKLKRMKEAFFSLSGALSERSIVRLAARFKMHACAGVRARLGAGGAGSAAAVLQQRSAAARAFNWDVLSKWQTHLHTVYLFSSERSAVCCWLNILNQRAVSEPAASCPVLGASLHYMTD